MCDFCNAYIAAVPSTWPAVQMRFCCFMAGTDSWSHAAHMVQLIPASDPWQWKGDGVCKLMDVPPEILSFGLSAGQNGAFTEVLVEYSSPGGKSGSSYNLEWLLLAMMSLRCSSLLPPGFYFLVLVKRHHDPSVLPVHLPLGFWWRRATTSMPSCQIAETWL